MLKLPYPDASFDIVWAWGTVHHTTDPLGAITELIRVLKPGGSLFLAIYKKTNVTWIHEAIRKTLIKTPRRTWNGLAKVMAFFGTPIVFFFKRREKSRKGEKPLRADPRLVFRPHPALLHAGGDPDVPRGQGIRDREIPGPLGPVQQLVEFHLQIPQTGSRSPIAHWNPRGFPPETGPPFLMFAMGDHSANTLFGISHRSLGNPSRFPPRSAGPPP